MKKLNKDKLILPVVILLACIILGGFYYANQVSKQKSIERQQTLKLEEERKTEEAKLSKEQQEKEEAGTKTEEAKKIKQDCQDESEKKARDLLKNKMDLEFSKAESQKRNDPSNQYAGILAQQDAENLKVMVDKAMFLKGDYDEYYKECLTSNGLEE